MSISSQIERIATAKEKIRAKMVSLGLATSTDTITQLASSLENVSDHGTPSAEVKTGETYTILPGYYHGGTVVSKKDSGDYPLQQKTGVIPTKVQQSITSDEGYYGLSEVVVEPIPSGYEDVSGVTAGAGDVLANKVFVDSNGTPIAGQMLNNGRATKSITGLGNDMSVTLGDGYYSEIVVTLSNDIETQLASI